MNSHQQQTLTKSQLREQRLQELLNSCQQQVLQQIIGPFGLTPAMFDDKDGGNVTTQNNAEKGLFAKKSEEYNRNTDYDYKQAKQKKMKPALVIFPIWLSKKKQANPKLFL